MKNAEQAQLPPSTEPRSALSLEEVHQCTRLLSEIAENRILLNRVPEADRKALLAAAGRLVHPDRDAKSRLQKALRRERKETKREH
ncbi:MAG TPA: oxidoreductase, partial [Archangium sp.]|nr:oxidoreductase [Archangium sp.]